MKGAAEMLGVSYGTLYGRYRETFGYLKHGWNSGGGGGGSGTPNLSKFSFLQRLDKIASGSANVDLGNVDQEQIFEQLKAGRISMRQAGSMLGMDQTMIAYQLALLVRVYQFLLIFYGLKKIAKCQPSMCITHKKLFSLKAMSIS